jgi:CO/xanthine dehydrogenase FAD-binding subunit
VRYVGTIGGNVANGDPGNDMPAVMLCLGATYEVAGQQGGPRRIAAREFYQGAYVTALRPGEIVTAVRVPVPPAGHGAAYEKLKRKVGDYATAAAAVMLTLSAGRVASCAIGPPMSARRRCWPRKRRRSWSGRTSTRRPSNVRSPRPRRSRRRPPTIVAPRPTARRWPA